MLPLGALLWWIDIQGQRLLGFAPATGERSEHRLPLMPGFVVGRRSGGLALGLEDGIYAFDPADGWATGSSRWRRTSRETG